MAELSRGQILKDPEVIGTSTAGGKLILWDGDETNTVTIKAPDSISTNYILTLPANDGDNSQYLQTDGSGNLSWQTVTASAAGSTGQIQYNSGGNFAAAAGLTTDGTHLTITAAGELRFADTTGGEYVAFKAPGTVAANRTYTLPAVIGSAGQVLKVASAGRTDTAATLEWADDLQGAGATPGGATGDVQYRSSTGTFEGEAAFNYNTTTNLLSVNAIAVNNSITFDNGNVSMSGATISVGTGELFLNPQTAVAIQTNKPLRFYDASNGNRVAITGPASVTSSYTLTFPSSVGAADDILAIDGTGNVSFINNYRTLNFVIENSASVITTGVKGYVVIDFDCQVTGWTILGSGEASGAIVVDIWKDTYANYPPTDADSITGTELPTITSGQNKGQDTSITTWASTTVNGVSTVGGIAAGDILGFNVDSVTNFTRVTVALRLKML